MEAMEVQNKALVNEDWNDVVSYYDYYDEMDAVKSFWNQIPSDTKVTIHKCSLRDAIREVCLAPLNKRRALILYFHNSAYQFSKTFCKNLDRPEISELIEHKFFFLGWDISNKKFFGALMKALEETVVLSNLKRILLKKEAAAFLIVPIENTISLYTLLNGPKIGVKDIVTALKSTVAVLPKENEQESQLAELTKKNGMEIQAVLSFWNQISLNTKVTSHMCRLRDAIREVCLSPLNKRRVLILYFHNSAYQFSKTFCQNLDTPEISELIERNFFFFGWDVSNVKFVGALMEALDETVVLSNLKPILLEKEAAAFLVVPTENTIKLYTLLKGPKIGVKDIVTALKNAVEDFQKENEQESQLAELTKKNGSENDINSIKYQMLMADMLGDRDYDRFEYYEHTFLKQKIGFALYGPPKEEKGYNEEENKRIEEIYKIIIENSNEIAEFKDMVELSFITNYTEPLPEEKLKHAKKQEDCNPDTDEKQIPVFVLRKCRCSDNPCRIFIDHTGRVYTSWMKYLSKNKLSKCKMIVPKNGRYEVNENDEVLLTTQLSPACSIETKILQAADIGTAAGGIISGGIFVAAAIPAVAVAPVALVAAGVAGLGIGIYSIARSSYALHDRNKHKQTISFANSEARGAYLNIVAGSLGFVGAGANVAVSQLAVRGFNIGKGASAVVNTIGVANMGAGGAAVLNSSFDVVYKWIKDNEKPSMLTIVQLGSSILFFGHSVYSFKTCSTIVQESQVQTLQKYQSSLRSNRHRKTFNKLLKETVSRNDGVQVKGCAEVIKAIHNIPNKDEVFAVLTRSNKAMNEKGIRFSAHGGQIKLNGVTIDMNTFTQMNKKQVNSFLTNLSSLSASATTGETVPITLSSSFFQGVAFSGLSWDVAIKIVSSTCKIWINLCRKDVKSAIVEAAFELISYVGKDYIAWLNGVLSADEALKFVIIVVVKFFSHKADELEAQYNKWKETGDPQYYNRIFRNVDVVANLYLKFFESLVVASSSGGGELIKTVLIELCDYFTACSAEEYYEKEIRDEKIEKRKAHAAAVRVQRVNCNVCGGHYFSRCQKVIYGWK